MSLIKCPECGREISEYAFKCPECGKINKKRKSINEVDVNEEEYESKYFSYANTALEKSQESEKKKKKRFRAIIICIILSICIAMCVKIIVKNNQIKEDREKFSVLGNLIGTEKNIDGCSVSSTAYSYFDEGIVLFGNVNGSISFNDDDTNTITKIYFSPEDEITVKQMRQILKEIEKIYGEYDSYEEDIIDHIYIWNTDNYNIYFESYSDLYSNSFEKSSFHIEWRSKD